ncbi:MAG TPA: AzlC family ABC transporter permease [Pseudolabrys sp.]|nr:AzlC family ABC transporter permease [Pseudolabrys sp.]
MSVLPASDATTSGVALAGARQAWSSVFVYVLFATYVGVGALAHDFGFSVWWLVLSTVIVWAAPAQVILISLLGVGAPLIEIAVAVTLTAVRLFPMTVSLLPLMRTKETPVVRLLLPAHFTSISMWVESLRLLPMLPMAQRIAYANGLAMGLMLSAILGGFAGFYLAAGLPTVLAAALLFMTPLSFLISVLRNSHESFEKLAFVLGLVIGPILALSAVGLDLMWTGVIGGGLAYGWRRFRGPGKRVAQ